MGHGEDGSPELYSGSPEYLITAGGVARDRFTQAVARPTTLMLNDGVLELPGLLQITGSGDDFRGWNNTGVFMGFAVGKRLRVPKNWRASAAQGDWSLYVRDQVRVVVYANARLALFYIVPQKKAATPAELLSEAVQLNPENDLEDRFQTLDGGVVHYDVDADLDTWVISSVVEAAITSGPGEPYRFDRNFGHWPLLQDQQSTSTTSTVQSGNPNES